MKGFHTRLGMTGESSQIHPFHYPMENILQNCKHFENLTESEWQRLNDAVYEAHEKECLLLSL
jgi:hypothetical protein